MDEMKPIPVVDKSTGKMNLDSAIKVIRYCIKEKPDGFDVHFTGDIAEACLVLVNTCESMREEIAEHDQLEELRRNREHASNWVTYWRNKTGKDKNWYPDWDEIFLDWEERGKKIEELIEQLNC
jgi:hypothetical protein